jgi:glutamyl/glutaminyl-tRNA synthetase
MVILRSNGYPTYNFCSILDDYDYDVTNIKRSRPYCKMKLNKGLFGIKFVEGNKTFPELTHAGLLFEGNKKLLKEVVTELPRL